MKLHQHLVLTDFGHRRVVLGDKSVEALLLALHHPLFHSRGGHFGISTEAVRVVYKLYSSISEHLQRREEQYITFIPS